jgi:hypothetical protein
METAAAFEKGFNDADTEITAFRNEFFPLIEYLAAKGSHVALDEFEMINDDLYEYLRPTLRKFSIKN